MSFNYDKLKQKNEQKNDHWATYSDLFMVLSFVFLLLYVTASLRNGTNSIQKQMEQQELVHQVQDLQDQIRVYDSLKDGYLKQKASEKEKETYEELMDKLTLLKDEAKEKSDDLAKQAAENKKKSNALNQYQQIVRNIINANLVSNSRIKHRDGIIKEKEEKIQEKKAEIKELNETVEEKQKLIKNNEKQISKISENLETKEAQFKWLVDNKRMTVKKYKKRMANLKKKSYAQINQLKKVNTNVSKELNQAKTKIKVVNTQLETTKKDLYQKSRQEKALLAKIEETKKKTQQEISKIKRNHNLEIARAKALFENQLKKEKLSAAAKAKKLKAFQARMASKEQAMEQKISGLNLEIRNAEKELQVTEQKLGKTEEEKRRALASIKSLERSLNETREKNNAEIKALRSAHNKGIAKEKARFNARLDKQKLSAKAKARKLRAFRAAMAKKEGELKKKIYGLNKEIVNAETKLKKTSKQLGRTLSEKDRAVASAKNLEQQNVKLASNLKRARHLADAKKRLIREIKKNFRKNNIDATVDEKTGDVLISFGNEYFDAGAARLKPKMRKIVDRTVPVYAKSLFSNSSVAKEIESVEIIGFASPTYQGKFVHPASLDPKDRKAISYNIELSIKRANAILGHILDMDKFSNKKNLHKKIKVSGRGFLAEDIKGRGIASGMPRRKFCKIYDCEKSQRVLIKFNLKQ